MVAPFCCRSMCHPGPHAAPWSRAPRHTEARSEPMPPPIFSFCYVCWMMRDGRGCRCTLVLEGCRPAPSERLHIVEQSSSRDLARSLTAILGGYISEGDVVLAAQATLRRSRRCCEC
uniref:Predicted protein n=1 Tax=Hordeum vulgare subsp. vulgare TaxID=112509 RepID=F2DAR3_HORVV|nr:predicted protein [Hordeum vulgare subsp. vulgare]